MDPAEQRLDADRLLTESARQPVNRATRKPRRVRGVESRRASRTLSKALQNGFRIGELHHVEPSLNSVTGPAGTTRLEPKVMQVLVCLAAQAGQVVPKERLMRTVWPDTFVGDDVLTRSISELRRVFGDDVKEPRFIQTIPKSGYRLIAGVSSNAGHGLTAPGQDAVRSRCPPSPKPHARTLVLILGRRCAADRHCGRRMVDCVDAPGTGCAAASAHHDATHREPS